MAWRSGAVAIELSDILEAVVCNARRAFRFPAAAGAEMTIRPPTVSSRFPARPRTAHGRPPRGLRGAGAGHGRRDRDRARGSRPDRRRLRRDRVSRAATRSSTRSATSSTECTSSGISRSMATWSRPTPSARHPWCSPNTGSSCTDEAYEQPPLRGDSARGVRRYDEPGRLRFVCGSMGPTTKAISVTGGVTFDGLLEHYRVQARRPDEGGADYLLLGDGPGHRAT